MIELFQLVIGGVKYITPDGWISFIGSLLGFLGIFITIMYTKKQFKEEKRIGVKPYLNFEISKLNNPSDNWLGVLSNQKNNEVLRESDKNIIEIHISNLGIGNCVELRVNKMEYCDTSKCEDHYLGNIEINKSKECSITIITKYKNIIDQLNEEYSDFVMEDKQEFNDKINKEYIKNIILEIEYKDVLENKYKKTVFIEVSISWNISTYIDDISKIDKIEFGYMKFKVRNDINKQSIKKS